MKTAYLERNLSEKLQGVHAVLEVVLLNWIKAFAQLLVAEHKTLKNFVVGAWEMLQIDLEDSQIPCSMQECHFHLRNQSLGENIAYFCH